MTVGISGSGKTYWSAAYCTQNSRTVHHSSDIIRGELYGDEDDQIHNAEVFEEMKKRTFASLMNGDNVVYDATNLNRKRRKGLLKEIKTKFKGIETQAVIFAALPQSAIGAQQSRERKVLKEVIYRQVKQFQVPIYQEGFTHIELVNMTPCGAESFLRQNIIPHDSKWHTKENIIDHMIHTGDAAAQMGEESILIAAARYHDIGKSFCKTVDEDGEAHYRSHENVSAYFILMDESIPFSHRLNISMLINYHMAPYTYNEKGLERLRGFLGYRNYEDLMKLNKYDKLCA